MTWGSRGVFNRPGSPVLRDLKQYHMQSGIIQKDPEEGYKEDLKEKSMTEILKVIRPKVGGGDSQKARLTAYERNRNIRRN